MIQKKKLRDLSARTGVWEAEGTRLELVLVPDPNGGLLIAWPDGGWVGRAHPQYGRVSVHTLAGRISKPDLRSVRAIVERHQAELGAAW